MGIHETKQSLKKNTFPIDPSPKNADWSKFSVASANSSMEKTRHEGATCVPASDMIPSVSFDIVWCSVTVCLEWYLLRKIMSTIPNDTKQITVQMTTIKIHKTLPQDGFFVVCLLQSDSRFPLPTNKQFPVKFTTRLLLDSVSKQEGSLPVNLLLEISTNPNLFPQLIEFGRDPLSILDARLR